jgi:hypothetical protein
MREEKKSLGLYLCLLLFMVRLVEISYLSLGWWSPVSDTAKGGCVDSSPKIYSQPIGLKLLIHKLFNLKLLFSIVIAQQLLFDTLRLQK